MTYDNLMLEIGIWSSFWTMQVNVSIKGAIPNYANLHIICDHTASQFLFSDDSRQKSKYLTAI